jgi:hypothetical protein
MTLTFAILHVAARVPPLHERAQPPPRTADHVGGCGPPNRHDKTTRANMLTKAFPFLLPRYIERDLPAKLRDLAGDIESLRSDGTPADAKLASAPLLVDWRCVLTPVGLRLAGFVAGHPLLGNCAAMTSQVWVASADGRWIRTLSRYYRLGIPANSHLSAALDEPADHDGQAGGLHD